MTAATFAAIVAAGAAGAVARAWVSWALTRAARRPGAGTMVVNLAGAFLAGAIAGGADRLAPGIGTFAAVGFLGAFTTFSTWMAELHGRWRSGARGAHFAEASLTLAVGCGLAALGARLAG